MRSSSTLLLAGRFGHGKSATGNSILGKKVFKPRSSNVSRSPEILREFSDEHGVTVLDGADIDDLNQNSEHNFKSLFDSLNKMFEMLVGGVNVIVLMLMYGIRFTRQEKDAVDLIRSIFGQNVLKKHGVIVMTHGDNFEMDMEDEGRSFKDWCSAQTGDVKSLFEECGSRVVLFNNKAQPDKMKAQNKLLMSEVSKVKSPYTQKDYNDAEGERLKILVRIKLPRLLMESNKTIDGIYKRLDKADHSRDVVKELQNVMKDLESHKEKLTKEDEKTGVLEQLLVQVNTLKVTIKTRIDTKQKDSRGATTGVPISPSVNREQQETSSDIRLRPFTFPVIVLVFLIFLYHMQLSSFCTFLLSILFLGTLFMHLLGSSGQQELPDLINSQPNSSLSLMLIVLSFFYYMDLSTLLTISVIVELIGILFYGFDDLLIFFQAS